MWTYKNKYINSHNDLHPDCKYIVYELLFEDCTKYIGYKVVRSNRKLPATKKQLEIRKNYKRVELKNISFANYKGSSQNTKNKVPIKKEILYQCSDKRSATYLETQELFKVNAIFNDNYLNKNIQGCFFDNALNGVIP